MRQLMPRGVDVVIRPVRPADARALYEFVARAGTLELNSPYCYALLADHFRKTGVVAERDGRVIGVALGYVAPTRPRTAFVWQIGVDAACRGLGIGGRLLAAFVEAEGATDIEYLEATVTPDNTASRALFTSFATARGTYVMELRGYDDEHLPAGHAPERLLRIGPLRINERQREKQ